MKAINSSTVVENTGTNNSMILLLQKAKTRSHQQNQIPTQQTGWKKKPLNYLFLGRF
jgi:hypothetical protein